MKKIAFIIVIAILLTACSKSADVKYVNNSGGTARVVNPNNGSSDNLSTSKSRTYTVEWKSGDSKAVPVGYNTGIQSSNSIITLESGKLYTITIGTPWK